MGSITGNFQIRMGDSVKFNIRKNHIISQTYIADFKDMGKQVIKLPWQFQLAKKLDIYLDDNVEYDKFMHRVANETKPSYLFIANTKVPNNGVLDLTWAEILN
jgi:hypothetical protein